MRTLAQARAQARRVTRAVRPSSDLRIPRAATTRPVRRCDTLISRPSTDTLLRPRNLDRGRFLPHLGQITVRSLFRSGTFPNTGQPEVRTPDSARLADTGIFANRKNGRVALQRMDNVGIVVESLDAAISFFAELGLELEGRAMIEGDWSGRVTGLRDQRVETAMMRMPDGHGRIELSRFLAPPVVADHRNAPVNALGYLRVMFAVDDLDDTLARLRRHGAQLVDEVVQYDVYRLCYVRGPEGILIGLAEQIG